MVQAWPKRGLRVRWHVGLDSDGQPEAEPHHPTTAVSRTFWGCAHGSRSTRVFAHAGITCCFFLRLTLWLTNVPMIFQRLYALRSSPFESLCRLYHTSKPVQTMTRAGLRCAVLSKRSPRGPWPLQLTRSLRVRRCRPSLQCLRACVRGSFEHDVWARRARMLCSCGNIGLISALRPLSDSFQTFCCSCMARPYVIPACPFDTRGRFGRGRFSLPVIV